MLAAAAEQAIAGWPMVLAMAGVLGGVGVREARRRSALNRALHEVRRPLQVLALSAPVAGTAAGELEGPVRMAAAALERLDREINGGGAAVATRTGIRVGPLLTAAVERWRAPAAAAGRSLELRCRCPEAVVDGVPAALGSALDNLIANAVAHGGARITVTATPRPGRLRIVVVDSGKGAGRPGGERSRRRLATRIAGSSRHGHGLRIVRRIAADHGGSFSLRVGSGATEAVLELPLAGGGRGDE